MTETIRTDNSETLKNALLKIKALEEQIEKMKCCANCKHSEQGEYDEFENCSRCHAKDCYCRIKQQTRNSAGKYHDWDDKCDKWEIKEIAE